MGGSQHWPDFVGLRQNSKEDFTEIRYNETVKKNQRILKAVEKKLI